MRWKRGSTQTEVRSKGSWPGFWDCTRLFWGLGPWNLSNCNFSKYISEFFFGYMERIQSFHKISRTLLDVKNLKTLTLTLEETPIDLYENSYQKGVKKAFHLFHMLQKSAIILITCIWEYSLCLAGLAPKPKHFRHPKCMIYVLYNFLTLNFYLKMWRYSLNIFL